MEGNERQVAPDTATMRPLHLAAGVSARGGCIMTSTVNGLLLVGLLAITPRANAAPPAAPVSSVCKGVPDAERYIWLLTNRRDVLAVDEIRPEESMIESLTPDPRAGARVLLAAGPGVTAEWLERIGECHIAQIAARGYPQGAAQSPLDVKGAEVRVSSVGDGFAVDIRSYDWKAGREILRRARALLSPPAGT
jgi:hypothetical protein